jgi:chloramphenicol-sensitive protein RarD
MDKNSHGLSWGIVSYLMWGFFPIYWKLLKHFSHFEILAHRVIWAFFFYWLILIFHKNFVQLVFKISKKDFLLSSLAGVLLTINWGLYIYAVNSGHILEGSLAYFINPILNVAIGVTFFKEEFPWPLKWAVFFASLGILYKISFVEGFPWISLTLAFTFAIYGVLKKMSGLPVRVSSVLESVIGLLPAIGFSFYFSQHRSFDASISDYILLIGGGIVTGLPLFLFSYAAQRIPYSILGMIQFLAPSLQFLVGVFLFNEALNNSNLIAFCLIWIAVGFYLVGSYYKLKVDKS